MKSSLQLLPAQRATAVKFSRNSTRVCASSDTVHILGGGVGGLAAACFLGKQGVKTVILERGDTLGGRLQTVRTPLGYRFDTGPSLMLFPQVYHDTFRALGFDLSEIVPLHRIEPAGYRLFYGDGSSLDLLYDVDAMSQQLESVETGAGDAYRRFLRQAEICLSIGNEHFIYKDSDSLVGLVPPMPALLRLAQTVNPANLLLPHSTVLSQFFRDPRIKAMFSFQDLYVGLSPYTAPAVYNLLPGTELLDGVFYPMGGWSKISSALETIARDFGAQVRTGVDIDRIQLSEEGTVRSLRIAGSGESIPCSTLVCNRDVPAAYELLTTPSPSSPTASYIQQTSSQLEGKRYSCGVIAYYWSVNKRVEGLLHHNVFLSEEFERSWERATSPATLMRQPNFYVHVPSKTDPDAAPQGCESIMVLLPVANLQEMGLRTATTTEAAGTSYASTYDALIDEGRDRILAFFNKVGIKLSREDIVEETVRPPPEWGARYGIKHGAVFAISHGLDSIASMRPSPEEKRIPGLYFAGASSRPGNGVPLALVSGRFAARRVLQNRRPGAEVEL